MPEKMSPGNSISPESRESSEKSQKPPPQPSSELTETALSIVAANSGLKEQIRLRRVSKALKSIIDTNSMAYKSLHITISTYSIYVKYDKETRVKYTNGRIRGISSPDYGRRATMNATRTVQNRDYRKMVLRDVELALSNPANRFQLIAIECHQRAKQWGRVALRRNVHRFFGGFVEILFYYNFKVHVEKLLLQVDDLFHVHSILDYLQPGILHQIDVLSMEYPIHRAHRSVYAVENGLGTWRDDMDLLGSTEEDEMTWNESDDDEDDVIMRRRDDGDDVNEETRTLEFQHKISQMDQFALAKRVVWFHSPLRIPLENFYRFKYFELLCDEIQTIDLVTLKEGVFSNDYPTFRYGRFYTIREICLQNPVESLEAFRDPAHDCLSSWRCDIPGTTEHLVFYFGDRAIFVRRMEEKKKKKNE